MEYMYAYILLVVHLKVHNLYMYQSEILYLFDFFDVYLCVLGGIVENLYSY